MQRESDFPPGNTSERDFPVCLDPGTVIDGRYRLIELIGEGGMGQVFEGEHLDLRRKVAIKMLASQGRLDAQLVKRFEREAHTLAAVSHPNVVTVTDYGVFEDLPYLVMERLEGRSLACLLEERGTLTVEHAAGLMRQVLAGLGHAHARGLVHRDLKPGNVWVETHDDGEHVKLLDFGFAKFVESEGATLLTRTGIVVGTIAYMSPEQASGGAIDHRSDVYSAGVLFYEMVTGRRPFEGEPIEILRAHLTADPPSLRAALPDRAFSPALEAVVARALAKKPADRFESAAELAKALQAAASRDAEPVTLVDEPRSATVDVEAKTIVLDEPTLVEEPRIRPVRPPPAGVAPAKVTGELRTRELDPLRPPAAAKARMGEKTSPNPGRPRRGRWRAGRVVGVLAVALVAVGIAAVLRFAPWPLGAAGSAGAGAPDLVFGLDEVDEPPPEGDAWNLWPRSARLERHRTAVRRGGTFSRETLRDLRAYEREHPDDPRVELLVARAFVNARWFSDALDRFAAAHAKDARIAESADFLEGLVGLVRYEVTSTRAAELVERIYGDRAAPAVEGALAAEVRSDSAAVARLEALLRRLRS